MTDEKRENSGASPEDIHCSTCHTPLHPLAKKCVACDSYQDWRRHLNLSSSVLALLVALVSVIGLSAPIVTALLTPKDSKLEVQYQGATNDRAFFLVTNAGVRAGSVMSVTLDVARSVEGFKDMSDNRIAWRFPIAPVVVQPGGTIQITAELNGEARKIIDGEAFKRWQNNNLEKPKPEAALRFSVRYKNFRGHTIDKSLFEPDLNSLLVAGSTSWHRCAGSLLTSAWNGDPTSHMIPEQIVPEVVTERCGPLPAYLTIVRTPSVVPQPDADFE